jgi:hypothetical protein
MKAKIPLLLAFFVVTSVSAQEDLPLKIGKCQLDDTTHSWPTKREREAFNQPRPSSSPDPVIQEYLLQHPRALTPPDRPDYSKAIPISWDDAKRMILRGYVTVIVQSHNRGVDIKTSKGSSFTTIEPRIGEVFNIASVVDPCRLFILRITE